MVTEIFVSPHLLTQNLELMDSKPEMYRKCPVNLFIVSDTPLSGCFLNQTVQLEGCVQVFIYYFWVAISCQTVYINQYQLILLI